MKLSNAVTFLLVRSFSVTARLNSLSTQKQPSQRSIDTKLFSRVREVTAKHAKARRVLQVIGGAFGLGNETSSLAGFSDGFEAFLNQTGAGGGVVGLFNGTQTLLGGMANSTNSSILNGNEDVTNELLEVLFGKNITEIFAGLGNGTMENLTDIFGDLSGGFGPFGGLNGTESEFSGIPNGTDLFGGMFNGSSDFFGFLNGTDIIGGMFNGSSGVFGFSNGTAVVEGFFNGSSGILGLPNETDILEGLFNDTGGVFGFPNGTAILEGFFNGSSGILGLPNGTDLLEGLFNGLSGVFGLPNGTFNSDELFNGTGNVADIFVGFFNGTGDVTSDLLESLFGENITEIISDLMNGTLANGGDIFGGMSGGLGDLFGGFNGTDMMVCPETCAAEVCDIFTSEDGPDFEVLSDACEAGTIKECAGMYASLCEFLCNDDVIEGATSSFFDFNASEVGDICSMCSFLDCCDGNNSFQTCVALLPAEALPNGVVVAGETGNAVNESGTNEVAVDEETVDVGAANNQAVDEGSTNSGSAASENTVETTADASREPEDGSKGPMLLMSKCVYVVFLATLLFEF